MFNFFSKDEQTELNQLLQYINQLLQGFRYKQAGIELEKIKDFSIDIVPELKQFFHTVRQSNDLDSILTVGIFMQKYQPKDLELANFLGNTARQADNTQQAIEFYTYALRIDPSFRLALYNLAATEAKVDKYDQEVANMLEPFLKPEFILPPFWEKPDSTASFLETLDTEIRIEQERNREKKLTELAEQHIEANDQEDSKLSAKIAAQIEKLTNVTFEIKNTDRIKMLFTTLPTKTKDSQEWFIISLNLALLYMQEKLYAKAVLILNYIITNTKNLVPSYANILHAICLYKTKNPKFAIYFLYEFLKDNPFNRYALINLGKIYLRENKARSAFKYLLIGANLLEVSDNIYLISELEKKALIALENHNLNQAIAFYKIITEETKEPHTWINLGEAYLKNNQTDDAVTTISQSLSLYPTNQKLIAFATKTYDSLMRKGLQHLDNKKEKEALTSFSLALRIHTTKEVLDNILEIYKKQDKKQELQEFLKLYNSLQDKLEKEKINKQYNECYKKAQVFLGQQNILLAVTPLLDALQLKPKKKIFSLLLMIYKQLKDKEGLNNLIELWNRLQLQLEDQKKLEIEKRQQLKVVEDTE